MPRHPARPRTVILATTTVLGALAVPAVASATTYCVAKPACVTAGGTARADVTAALSSATAAGDRVEIGPGTFTAPSPGFVASGSGPLTIVGSGSGAGGTVLTRTPVVKGADYAAGSVIQVAGRPTDLSGVAVELPQITGNGAGFAETFGVSANSAGLLRDLVVRTAPGYGGSGRGATGLRLRGSVTVSGVTVAVDAGAGTTKAAVVSDTPDPAAPITIADSSLSSPDSGVQSDGSRVAIRRSTIIAPNSPVNQSGGTLTVESSVLRGRSRVLGNAGQGPATATFDNVTVTSPTATDAPGNALQVWADGAATSLTLRDSIVGGYDVAVDRRSTGTSAASLVLRQNDLQGATQVAVTGTMVGSTDATGTVSVDPQFADRAAGDLRLAASSPLVDAGLDPAPTGLGADRAGTTRVVDGNGDGTARIDLGAFERPAPTPPVAPATPVTPAPVTPAPTTPAPVIPAPGGTARPGFSGTTGITARTSSSRVRRGAPVRLVLSNANAFGVRARISATTSRPRRKAVRWTSRTASVSARGTRTISLRVPAAARSILRRTGRLSLALRVVATAPDGGTRTVRRTVRVTLRR